MIKSLTLHGFKSFCNRTTLSFSPGVTAIIGPNGCGKSNLVDAFRWVLGEQNPRTLRCENSVDVIFSGTEQKKAMGLAEVKLLLDAPDGRELEIVRRLTRDGESLYLLNGAPCRLRDVVKVTSQLGLSSSGYVVIGQGMIHELAGGRPEERRQWIEEAAGVGIYRTEKREAEKRLEQVEAELRRLDDLLVELEARKGELEDARRVAARYRELVAYRKTLEAGMWLWDLDHARRKLESLKKKHSDLREWAGRSTARIAQLESLKRVLEGELSSLRETQGNASEERERISRLLVDMSRQRDEISGMMEALGREIEARSARCRALEDGSKRLAGEKRAVAAKMDELNSRRTMVLAQLEEIESVRRTRQQLTAALRSKVADLRQKTVDLMSKLREVQDTMNQRRSVVESLRSRVISLQTEISGTMRAVEQAKNRKAECQHETERTLGEISSLRDGLDRAAEDVRTIEEQREAVLTEERRLRAELSRVSERMKVLAELERAHEGLGKGTRVVLEAAARGIVPDVVGAVGELVSCDRRYIPALSAALGGSVDHIVVRTEKAARWAIELLRKEKAGRVTFLPLELLRPRDLTPEAKAALHQVKRVSPLAQIISYPAEIEKAVRYLLGRVVLAEDMDAALDFMRRAGWSCRVVTMSGESLEPGGSITGGEMPRHAQVFERRKELDDLHGERDEISRHLEAVTPRLEDLERRLREASERRGFFADRVSEAEARMRALKEEIARLDRIISEGEARIRGLSSDLEDDQKSLAKAEELLRQSGEEESALQGELSRAMGELRRYEEELRQQETGRGEDAGWERLGREKEALDAEVASLARRSESLDVEAASLVRALNEEQRELSRLVQEKEVLSRKYAELQSSIEGLDREVLALTDRMTSVRAQVEEKERALKAAADEKDRLERECSGAAIRMGELEAEIAAQAREVEKIELLLRKEYGIEPDTNPGIRRFPRDEAISALEKVDSEMGSLGEPNLRAEAEYEALAERISRYVREKEEATGAREELVRIRDLAEREMKRRFKDTFDSVRNHFREIFTELFGGGKGDLVLTGDERGVEVIAQPPGARGRPFMMLSGGERSLTGLALVFALIRTRPSPLVVLDEVDTSLDEANVLRFGRFLKQLSDTTQFVVITHQKPTMEVADVIYGVTMDEPGVSRVLGIRLEMT